MSPQQCAALLQQIRAARARTVTGGYRMDPGYQTARAAEEAARDAMVAAGCNKKANAGTALCQGLIARVKDAVANRKAIESDIHRVRRNAATGEEVALTAQYEAECRNPTRTAQPRAVQRPRHRVPTDDETKVGVDVMIGIGTFLGGMRTNRGPSRGPSGHR
jgi:hypothetical protein